MGFSRTTEYAIRALIPLAQVPARRYMTVKTIAEQVKVPTYFLAKILQQLAHKGLLRSRKGPQGGYRLDVPAEEIRLLDIVEAMDEPLPFQQDAASRNDYPDGLYCIRDEEWVNLQSKILGYLKANTVFGLAMSLEAKQRALARRP